MMAMLYPGQTPVTMHALTLRGFVMQPELLTGLSNLAWVGRGATLHLSETRTGIVASVRCRSAIQQADADDRWTTVHDTARGHFTYCRVFEIESAPEIIGIIRQLVDRPEAINEAA